jgi:hypothetical protein
MKKLLLSLLSIGLCADMLAQEKALAICVGRFAFCGASGTTPTGRTIIVQGKKFLEGSAVCPVMDGPAIANMKLMDNSCASPDGTDKTVWSLFWYYDSVPQCPAWEVVPTVNRSFVVSKKPEQGMSNMFCFPCQIIGVENGVTLAKCTGPINEAALPLRRSMRAKNGQTSITQAPLGSPNPVGTIIPVNGK